MDHAEMCLIYPYPKVLWMVYGLKKMKDPCFALSEVQKLQMCCSFVENFGPLFLGWHTEKIETIPFPKRHSSNGLGDKIIIFLKYT